jgi:hypothetical protein
MNKAKSLILDGDKEIKNHNDIKHEKKTLINLFLPTEVNPFNEP